MTGLQKYVFGVLAVVASFIVSATASGCKKNTVKFVPADTIAVLPADTANKRILALGDSYTIGQSVSEADRFPNLTALWLRERGVKVKYPVEIIARTGWTTADLLSGITSASPQPAGPYDAVTLLIGVNNQYQGRDTGEYRAEFKSCLGRAIAFAGGLTSHVFVMSIPDWGATPYGANYNRNQIAIEIDRFNAINKQESAKMGVSYTDITSATRAVTNDNSLTASDGLHYSGKEHAIWAGLIGEKILPVIK
ncbi:MAG: SGNH/GDSL hydrolase family protein [Chitinophagaceae bacterium]